MSRFKRGMAVMTALGLAVTGAFMAPAQATSFHITQAIVPSSPGSLIANIYYPGIGTAGSVDARIGRIQLNGTDEGGFAVSLDTYCADIFDVLKPGTFTSADISAAPFSAARLAAATTFLAHADALVTNSTTSAAAQLGLWEILYEDSGTSWNVTSGTFRSDVASSAATQANLWLSDLANHDWQPDASLGLELLVPQQGNQLQFRLVAGSPAGLPSAPEPASWAMMLGGFGMIGGALRSRRLREVASKAAA